MKSLYWNAWHPYVNARWGSAKEAMWKQIVLWYKRTYGVTHYLSRA